MSQAGCRAAKLTSRSFFRHYLFGIFADVNSRENL